MLCREVEYEEQGRHERRSTPGPCEAQDRWPQQIELFLRCEGPRETENHWTRHAEIDEHVRRAGHKIRQIVKKMFALRGRWQEVEAADGVEAEHGIVERKDP